MNKRISGVDVNLDALKDVKSVGELRKEPGRIFGHLSSTDERAAYDELAAALGLTKASASEPSLASQPATSNNP
jgi:hypothetical protein